MNGVFIVRNAFVLLASIGGIYIAHIAGIRYVYLRQRNKSLIPGIASTVAASVLIFGGIVIAELK